jgi:hypothetical protein
MPGGAKIAIGLGVGIGFYAWLLLAGRERHEAPRLDLDGGDAGRRSEAIPAAGT